MEEVKLRTFEEFESKATALLEDREEKRKGRSGHFSEVLFRGQARASWKLTTTLERYSTKQYSPEDYYKVVRSLRPALQSCTGKHWEFSDKYSHDDAGPPGSPQAYEFMVYLRHHGFPSPLLDWTRSFCIAAFFAFQPPTVAEQDEHDVAIYALREYCGAGKRWCSDRAAIFSLGPYITTDRRHFIQQCEYTVCSKRVDGAYQYSSHEEVFGRNEQDQNVLAKFVIPIAERAKVLDRLRMMNITAYSLFGDEESLLERLAYEEIGRKDASKS